MGQPTVPDVNWLWRMYGLTAAADPSDLRDFSAIWRISRADWDYLLQLGTKAGVGYPMPGNRPTLFGVPVDVIEDGRARFPELVFTCDRRN
jgi:hypothetical protein